MASAKGCRQYLMGPLLLVNLVMYVIVLGLAGWSIDKYIDNKTHPYLGGNTSTIYLLIFSLLAGAVGTCSTLAGFLHLRAWRGDGLASAISSALISWAITALAFSLACKQILLGNRGRRLRTLEAFVAILTLTQLIYLILLHFGVVSSRSDPANGVMMENQKETSGTIAPPDA